VNPGWLHRSEDGLRLSLHVQPGAGRTQAAGLHDGRLRLRVNAPAAAGRANRRLQEWLAAEFGVARVDVELLSGARGRRKTVLIKSPRHIPGWLRTLVPEL
jgi:uncharacterized protein (TIGR00251 family)